jgi:hypothetical protein
MTAITCNSKFWASLLACSQGTLYGSGSMGGTVKVVTNQPKLDTWEGSVQCVLSDAEGGSGNGGGSFMLNIPQALTDVGKGLISDADVAPFTMW